MFCNNPIYNFDNLHAKLYNFLAGLQNVGPKCTYKFPKKRVYRFLFYGISK